MLFEKLINREVERRMHEENLRQEMWTRLDRMQKQIEELRFEVACMLGMALEDQTTLFDARRENYG